MHPEYIVIHTAASDAPGITAATIDEWHRARGWSRIGYHYVILSEKSDGQLRDGQIETGRDSDVMGAHCRGLNKRSIGICVVGDGDKTPFTQHQTTSLVYLCRVLCRTYDIPVGNVIGHREVNTLIDRGFLYARHRTKKTCPGRLNDMDALRAAISMRNADRVR